MRQAFAHEADVPVEEQLDCGRNRLGRHADGRAGWWPTAVQHEHVDTAVGIDGCGDELFHVVGSGEVARHGHGADPGGLLLEEVRPPGEHDHVRTLGTEPCADGEAHA